MLYAVVYGSDWDDINYFNDYYKAIRNVILQTISMEDYYPVIYEYDLRDGVYNKTDKVMWVNKTELLQMKTEYGMDYVFSNANILSA